MSKNSWDPLDPNKPKILKCVMTHHEKDKEQ
jgi:hypothetical protein